MIKIIIFAYIMGTLPEDTGKNFRLNRTFETMNECIEVLTENKLHPHVEGVYDIVLKFIKKKDFKYDWILAKCKNTNNREEYVIYPHYDNGIPEGIEEILEDKL